MFCYTIKKANYFYEHHTSQLCAYEKRAVETVSHSGSTVTLAVFHKVKYLADTLCVDCNQQPRGDENLTVRLCLYLFVCVRVLKD